MNEVHEVNFDGLVGPTHNYAGLSHGNVASMAHRGAVSRPRAAALQGLAKMKALADLGVKQAVLPPHERPHLAALRACGFTGSDAAVLRAAAKFAPEILAACASASNMWVANAATVCPGADAADGRTHFTVANLASKFHRAIEPAQTARSLRAIFRDETKFAVHDPVPGAQGMGDEGAANHTRLAPGHDRRGLHFFVYGHQALGAKGAAPAPQQFASRQALEASQAVARNHALRPAATVFAQQHPAAIDAGVFHNDVVCVGNENLLLCHERAFVNTDRVIAELRRKFAPLQRGTELAAVKVTEKRLPLAAAVRSYFFNSQVVTVQPARMALIAPAECREIPGVRAFIRELLDSGRTPLREAHYFDLKESMQNGGGPACLRLRVVLTKEEWAAVPAGVKLTERTYPALVAWVKRHYRETLTFAELADPRLLDESRRALDELTGILGLGGLYPFQS